MPFSPHTHPLPHWALTEGATFKYFVFLSSSVCGPGAYVMCCIIQTLLWKQIFFVSITAACCSSARVLPDFERIYFLNACISHVCGKWTCAARLRSGLLRGFSHLWVCFPAKVLSMPRAAQPAQQHCKTDPRNIHSAQPEDEKFKSVYKKRQK